jgi:hypothetical protein
MALIHPSPHGHPTLIAPQTLIYFMLLAPWRQRLSLMESLSAPGMLLHLWCSVSNHWCTDWLTDWLNKQLHSPGPDVKLWDAKHEFTHKLHRLSSPYVRFWGDKSPMFLCSNPEWCDTQYQAIWKVTFYWELRIWSEMFWAQQTLKIR